MPKHPKSQRDLRHSKKGLSWGDRIFIVGVGCLILLMIVLFYQPSSTSQGNTASQVQTSQQSPLVGTAAAEFNLPVIGPNGLTGNMASLSYFGGKVVLLEFMSVTCVHCINMIPTLEKLHEQFGSAIFISVVNGAATSVGDVSVFLQQRGGSWLYVYDQTGSTFTPYQVSGTPTFVVVARDGKISAVYEGEVSYNTLFASLQTTVGGVFSVTASHDFSRRLFASRLRLTRSPNSAPVTF